ncbi:MAG: HNH endonuclease [Gammaproteobacteria bacterium]|nr:HNH endonuclease [Gammaproteobacteria bacterium]
MATRNRGKAYTAEQSRFLIEGYQNYTITDLHKVYVKQFPDDPRTYAAIRSFICNRKITCGGQGKKDGSWRSSLFTREESELVAEWFTQMTAKAVAKRASKLFKRPFTADQIKEFTTRHDMKSGRTGRFEKGGVPANKGKKMPKGWAPGRMAETQFRPGDEPANLKSMWHERTDNDGYILMKCPITNPHTGFFGYYIPKHKWIWGQANGPIPKNHVLTFIDDNPSNCVLENLEMISRGELCRRNKMQYKQADPEARQSIKLIAKLQHNMGAGRRQEKA